MQTSRYLLSNRTNILINEAGYITEYKPVYTRELTVYKGIDNVLEFRLLNADQKPVDVDIYTPKFIAFDENKNLVIEHDAVVLQQGDSSLTTKKGMFKVTITENDLLNIKGQFLSYSIYLVDSDNQKVLTYSNGWFGAEGTIRVSTAMFPGPLNTYVVNTFNEDPRQSGMDDSVWISEAVEAQPGINGNEALHTAVIYASEYAGDVIVQATLDNQITTFTDWSDIATVSFAGNETQPKPVNFNGVYTFLRFVASANPTNKISKILVRN